MRNPSEFYCAKINTCEWQLGHAVNPAKRGWKQTLTVGTAPCPNLPDGKSDLGWHAVEFLKGGKKSINSQHCFKSAASGRKDHISRLTVYEILKNKALYICFANKRNLTQFFSSTETL